MLNFLGNELIKINQRCDEVEKNCDDLKDKVEEFGESCIKFEQKVDEFLKKYPFKRDKIV